MPSMSTPEPEIRPVTFEIEPVSVQVFSDTDENIDQVFQEIEKRLLSEESEKDIADPIVRELCSAEADKINMLQKQHQVSIKMLDDDRLKILGAITDVSQAALEIQMMINARIASKERARNEDLLAQTVTWMFLDKRDRYEAFSKSENVVIESGYVKNQSKISFRGQMAVVNFGKMSLDLGDGKTLKIKRVTSSDLIPIHWADPSQLLNQRVLIVEVKPSSETYQDIERDFKRSSWKASHNPGFRIVQILEIQNHTLWKLYATKKKDMEDACDASLTKAPVERILYHGTALEACEKINNNGFNRSYCGKNAVAFGNGVYFAVNSLYSMTDKYSPPDTGGVKHVYRARVLTGDSALGRVGMIEPPPKDPNVNSTLLFDSVTDSLKQPQLFVVFNDSQVYPEFLVKFKMMDS